MSSLGRRLAFVVLGVVAATAALEGYLRRSHAAARVPVSVRLRWAGRDLDMTAAPVHDTGQVSATGRSPWTGRTLAIERAGAGRAAPLWCTLVRAAGDGCVCRSFSPVPPEVLLLAGPDLDSWTTGQRGVLLDTIEFLLAEAGLPVAAIRVGPGLEGLTELLTRVRAPSYL